MSWNQTYIRDEIYERNVRGARESRGERRERIGRAEGYEREGREWGRR